MGRRTYYEAQKSEIRDEKMKPVELEQISDTIMNSCMRLGADEAVTVAQTNSSRMLKFVNNQIEINKAWAETTAAVIVVKDNKLAFTSIKDYSKPCIEMTTKKLLDFANLLEPSTEYRGMAHGPFEYKEVEKTFDKKVGEIGDKSVDIVESAINAALGQGAKRATGVLTYGLTETFLRTSHEVNLYDRGTAINLSIRAFIGKDESGHRVCCARVLDDFDPVKTGEEAGRIAKMARKPQKIRPGKYTILFDPLPFAELVNQVMAATPATAAESGLSFLQGKLDQKVASNIFTMWDDGRVPGGFASSMADEEGVPTQRTAVIEEGIMKTFLHNTSTALKYNTKTTANAGIIGPNPTNGVVKSGDVGLEEMISSIKKGLYVTNTWYTRFQNYLTGDFSTIPRDGIFLILDGEIKHPITGIRISENMLNILGNISGLGKEVTQIMGWNVEMPVFTPAAIVDNVRITKSTFQRPAQT